MSDDGFAEPGELPPPRSEKKFGQGCLVVVVTNAVGWGLIYLAVSSWLG